MMQREPAKKGQGELENMKSGLMWWVSTGFIQKSVFFLRQHEGDGTRACDVRVNASKFLRDFNFNSRIDEEHKKILKGEYSNLNNSCR